MEEYIYKDIEAYLGGDMTPEEQRQFEIRMSENPEIRNAVKVSNEINHHLNERSWLSIENTDSENHKKDIKDFMDSNEAKELKLKLSLAGQRYKKSREKSKIMKIVVAIAAIFVVGMFSIIFFDQNPNPDLLYASYYKETDLPSIVKRGDQSESLKNGIIAFKAKNYNNAITYFEDYSKGINNSDPLIYAYVGFSYLEINKIDEALNSFDTLLNSDALDNSKALWYKSLLYLKVNDTKNLKVALSKIIADPNNFNHKKAVKLLNELD